MNPDGRLITMRSFILMSCLRHCILRMPKEDELFTINLVKDAGNIEIKVYNPEDKKDSLTVNDTGKYTFKLSKGNKYRLTIKATHASGHYSIRRKRI